MKPVTVTNHTWVDQIDSLGRFGTFHGTDELIDVGVGIGFPIIHVGESETIF